MVIALATWSARTSRRVASLRKGLSRKLRNNVDHLQVEAALLPVAWKRHLVERTIEAGAGCRGSYDGADALQQAHDGQRTEFGDASLQSCDALRCAALRSRGVSWFTGANTRSSRYHP